MELSLHFSEILYRYREGPNFPARWRLLLTRAPEVFVHLRSIDHYLQQCCLCDRVFLVSNYSMVSHWLVLYEGLGEPRWPQPVPFLKGSCISVLDYPFQYLPELYNITTWDWSCIADDISTWFADSGVARLGTAAFPRPLLKHRRGLCFSLR